MHRQKEIAYKLLRIALTLCCLAVILESSLQSFARPVRRVGNPVQTAVRFTLDPSQSKFVARAFSGGLLWFKGHDHLVAAREFSGEVQITPDSINPASLELRVKTD